MMPSANKRRFWVGGVYFLPLIVGVILLIWALVPHLFFVYGSDAKETMSVFEVMKNTWSQCRQTMKGGEKNSPTAFYFSWIMVVLVALSWVALISNVVLAICSAVCAGMVLSKPVDDPSIKGVVRWMRFLCFNPTVYALTCFSAYLPFLIPPVLNWFYQHWFLYEMKLHYFGPPSWVVAVVLALVSSVTFLATRRLQREEKMDLFGYVGNDMADTK